MRCRSAQSVSCDDVAALQVTIEHRVGLRANSGDPRPPHMHGGAEWCGTRGSHAVDAQLAVLKRPARPDRNRIAVALWHPASNHGTTIWRQISLQHNAL